MKLKVSIDADGVRQIGLDKFSEHFYWPLPHKQHAELTMHILDRWENLYESLGPDEQALLLADAHFLGYLLLHIHSKVVEALCNTLNAELYFGSLGSQYLVPDYKSLGAAYEQRRGVPWRLEVKRQVKNLKFNNHIPVMQRLTRSVSPDALGIGSCSLLKRRFLRERNWFADNVYIEHIFPNQLSNYLPRGLFEAVHEFLADTTEHVRNTYGAELDEEKLATAFSKRLGLLGAFLEDLRNRKNLQERLLVTETANALHKTAALAFQFAGKEAIGFHHGNGMGGLIRRMNHIVGTGAYSKFVCPSEGCAETHRQTYNNSFLKKYRDVRFLSTESPYYKRLVAENSRRSLPGKVKNVMVMGFPMHARRNPEFGWYYFYFQLDLEIRLLKQLGNLGYHTLYKIHPETKFEVFDLIEPFCHRIVSNPFEKCWELADAFVVQYSASTTFGYTLCTNRPLFMLDLEKEFWFPEHYELLARRCAMIPAWFEQDGRIMYDQDALAEGLASKPELPDYAYVKKFMFQSGDKEII